MKSLKENINKITMPSCEILLFKVEPKLKADFIVLCDRENVDLTWAIQEYMKLSIDRGTLASSYYSGTHFRDREIETLKNVATNYRKLLKKFNSLQKHVSYLEKLIHSIICPKN